MIDKLVNFRLFFPLLTATLDFNSKFSLFYDEVDRIYKSCCPIKIKEVRSDKLLKPWLSSDLLDKINIKHDLFNRYKDGLGSYEDFLSYDKNLKKEIKKAKQTYYRNKYKNCSGDPASAWKVTNNILGNSKKSSFPSVIHHNSVEINDKSVICNIFNEYFVNIGQNLANNIQNNGIDPLEFMGERCLNTFNFMETTPLEIFNLIKQFKNKKTSINNIPVAVFKKISHVISPLLAELFNESIIAGIFPDKLKTGRVIPWHKNCSLADISNYRPITTLSIYSKAFEKLVHKRMISFISRYNHQTQSIWFST